MGCMWSHSAASVAIGAQNFNATNGLSTPGRLVQPAAHCSACTSAHARAPAAALRIVAFAPRGFADTIARFGEGVENVLVAFDARSPDVLESHCRTEPSMTTAKIAKAIAAPR
jgi:hypothetical protein